MGIANEAISTDLQSALASGLNTLSRNQAIFFTQYSKSTIPVDGYVFWVVSSAPVQYTGSLHQITTQVQDEDQTIAVNRIIFTATEEIPAFNAIDSNSLWVGEWSAGGTTIKVVFNNHTKLYQQAGLYHYSGDTVYPALESQLINSIADLPSSPIVSNSLPIWLSQNAMAPVYASYLVPSNITPPYISAHVEPTDTIPLGAFPIYEWPASPTTGFNNLPSSQLMRDTVKLTLYGFNNQQAIQYLSSLMQYSLNTDDFGFCNSPAIRDEKRIQSEIAAIAMKKTIIIQASYYQSTADVIARQLIISASINSITIS